jgi:serine/threonine protein kinase
VALTPGLMLDGRYRLTRQIAIGGMGEVWAAIDRTLGRTVAVKILKPELTSDPEFVDRFRVEAQITASLNNPGIAAVYDYGETASHPGGPKDTAFLVMELVSGEPLSAVLARTPRIPVDRVLDVLEQSGRALQEAHARGLVHRDIKPGNILITPTGQVKITDFGIAKVAHQVPVTKGGMVMGTAQYLAPEQASGGEARPASDVYALGIVGYECLAGFRPFGGDNPVIVAMAQIRNEPPPLPPDLPPTVVDLIRHALIKDAALRYPNGEVFANAVAAVRSGFAPPPTGAFALPPAGLPPTQAFLGPLTNLPAPTAVAAAPVNAPAQLAPRPVQTAPPTRRPSQHTGLAVLLALLILLLAATVGTAMYFSTSSPSGLAGYLTSSNTSADGLRE